jgi:2-keto-4-pentenoate hydratase
MSGIPCDPVRDLIGDADVAAAYQVQEINSRRGEAAGRRLVGRKIGLTAASVRRQLGVDQPDYGMLFADMALADGDCVEPGRVLQPKVEAEVAFVLGRPLDDEQVTMTDMLSAVDYALPAIEIVGSRIAAWNIRLADTIADNASSGLFVLGSSPRSIRDIDLALCGAVIERRGEPVSTGAGAACMGNPLKAALWLARTMVRNGRPLRAGDIILSGALGPMVQANAGDRFEARINGLGSVSIDFQGI